MLKILIIEDEEIIAQRLVQLLDQIEVDYKLCGIIGSVQETIAWLNENEHPDLIFADIQLSDGNSFTIFKAVEVKSKIIFTTSYDEFALDAITRHTVPLKQSQLLSLIGQRKLHQAIPIIQDMIDGVIAYDGKRLALFKALADIGGAEAKQLIRERIGAEDFAIKKNFLEAYANLHCGTDDALHLIDELINHRDNHVQTIVASILSDQNENAIIIRGNKFIEYRIGHGTHFHSTDKHWN